MQRSPYIILRNSVQLSRPQARLGMFNTRSGGRMTPPFAEGLAGGNSAGAQNAPAELKTESLNEAERRDLLRDPEIVSVTPVMPIILTKPVAASVDEVAGALQAGVAWGVATVAANASEQVGAGLTVAVLDTGIDPDHPAFRGVALERRNFSKSSHDDDVHGHGTHCAGTIFGRDVDGVRIGVARGVRRALIGKVLDDSGRGDSAAISDAIFWAQQNGASVISLSVSIDFAGFVAANIGRGMNPKAAAALAMSAYRDTVRLFDSLIPLIDNQQTITGSKGVVLVAASGNESERDATNPFVVDVDLPAAARGMVSVGAIGRGAQGHEVAAFSNTNPSLCAPGVDIVSAKVGGGLIAMSGTSMATPHVAGVALLWWEALLKANPRTRAEQIKNRLFVECLKGGFASSVSAADIGDGLVIGPRFA